ncbi:hypothetical protein ACRRTK_006803 [Alexandromys fortis]
MWKGTQKCLGPSSASTEQGLTKWILKRLIHSNSNLALSWHILSRNDELQGGTYTRKTVTGGYGFKKV